MRNKKEVIVKENIENLDETQNENNFQVVLYNDDVNLFELVLYAIMKACKTSMQGAFVIARKAHETGKSVCYVGDKNSCMQVYSVLSAYKLTCEVQKI